MHCVLLEATDTQHKCSTLEALAMSYGSVVSYSLTGKHASSLWKV
jgi:hypothetical protein